MRKLIVSTCLAMAMLCGRAELAQACGSVTIASMNWQSAELLANIDKFILNKGYGCSAEIVPGDTVPTITSMAERGQPDITPEGWLDLVPEVAQRGIAEGRIEVAGPTLPDGGTEGWWVPKYVADAHPEIKTIADLMKHPELFPAPDDPGKGAIYMGPQGWIGTVTTAQIFKAFDGPKHNFVLIDAGSSAGLDGSLAKAYERKKPWVGYYWTPTSLLGKYEMVRLDPGVPHDAAEYKRCTTRADCTDPKPNSWAVSRIMTLVSSKFAKNAGSPLAYLKDRSLPNALVNQQLAWMTDNQATGEDAARHFLKTNEGIWTKWVPAETAQKVKAALR